MVLDVHDFHAVQVEPHDQAFDRTGVAVVVRISLADPGQGAEEPAVLRRVLGAAIAGRPRVDHHHVEVGDAAAAHGFLPAGIFPDDLLGGQELLEHDGRLDAGKFGPQLYVAGGEGDNGFVGFALGSFAQDDVGLAVYRLAFSVAEDGVLVGLAQGDVDEAGAVFQVAVALEDAGGGLDLTSGQRVQGVADPRTGAAAAGVSSVVVISRSLPGRHVRFLTVNADELVRQGNEVSFSALVTGGYQAAGCSPGSTGGSSRSSRWVR